MIRDKTHPCLWAINRNKLREDPTTRQWLKIPCPFMSQEAPDISLVKKA
jgi:hypothetical protein